MRIILLLLTVVFLSCEKHTFDSDHRQIVAKNLLRQTVKNRSTFDVLQFKEDTLDQYSGTTIERPIRYTIEYVFSDSSNTLVHRIGEVIFTPDGKSVLETIIK
jgi:hypothetical protein